MKRFSILIAALLLGTSLIGSSSDATSLHQNNIIINAEVSKNLKSEKTVSSTSKAAKKKFALGQVPSYSGSAYVSINNGKPYFTAKQKKCACRVTKTPFLPS